RLHALSRHDGGAWTPAPARRHWRDPAELQHPCRVGSRARLGRSPPWHHAHACRSKTGRGRCRFQSPRPIEPVRGRQRRVPDLHRLEPDAQSRGADLAPRQTPEEAAAMNNGPTRYTRRSVAIGGGIAVALGLAAIGVNAPRWLRAKTAYDDL